MLKTKCSFHSHLFSLQRLFYIVRQLDSCKITVTRESLLPSPELCAKTDTVPHSELWAGCESPPGMSHACVSGLKCCELAFDFTGAVEGL